MTTTATTLYVPAPLGSLPPALSGERREIAAEHTGSLSWYQDRPSALPTDARPLLLIHSVNAAGSAYEVKPLYDHYRRERPVFAMELPGFGHSERSRRPYAPRLMTDAVLAVVEQVRAQCAGQAVDAIALSLSSEFLARAATEAPTAFRSLGLVSPTGFNRRTLRTGATGTTLGKPWVYRLISGPSLGRWLYERLTRRNVIRYFLRRTWGSAAIDEGLLDYDVVLTAQPGAEHAPLRFLSGFLFSDDSGTVYRRLSQPVWVAHGVRGDFVNYVGLQNFAEASNWKTEVMPTGALPHFELLADFVQRYDTWSAGLRG